jgi:putative inorganic carbon (HCO3(-)) transporter
VLPLFNYLRLQARHKLVQRALGAVMALALLTALASYSRGALLGAVAMAGMMWWRSRSKMLGIVLIIMAVVAVLMFMPEAWFARMYRIDHYHAHGSAASRLYIWRVAWLLALHHPLTGAGFHATIYQSVINTIVPNGRHLAIHSVWFQVLGELGFPLFFVWTGITVVGWRNARRIERLARGHDNLRWAEDLGRSMQSAIVAYAVTGSFLPIAYWDIYFTTLLALQAAIMVTEATLRREAAEASGEAPWRRGGLLPPPKRPRPGALPGRPVPAG